MPPPKPVLPTEQEADLVFRVQMAVYHYVLGYWKQGLAGIGAVLLVALVAGQTSTCVRDQQRETSAALAGIQETLPEAPALAQYGLAPRFDVADPEVARKLETAAEAFERVARDGHGLASAEAWFQAGDLWDQLGQAERATQAFQEAFDANRGGIYTYSAGNRLAASRIARGETEAAIATLRDMGSSLDGLLAEQAMFDLMDLLLEQGDTEGARSAATEFRARFAESPRVEKLVAIEARIAAPKGS
jgi:tetratricopeptide (TPR) repeat protein